jgi:hypothetical protein
MEWGLPRGTIGLNQTMRFSTAIYGGGRVRTEIFKLLVLYDQNRETCDNKAILLNRARSFLSEAGPPLSAENRELAPCGKSPNVQIYRQQENTSSGR